MNHFDHIHSICYNTRQISKPKPRSFLKAIESQKAKMFRIAGELISVFLAMLTSVGIYHIISITKGQGPHANLSLGHFTFMEFDQPRWWTDVLAPPIYYWLFCLLRKNHSQAGHLAWAVTLGWILTVPFALDFFCGYMYTCCTHLMYYACITLFCSWVLMVFDESSTREDLIWFAAVIVVNPVLIINGLFSGIVVAGLCVGVWFFLKRNSYDGDFSLLPYISAD